MIENAFNGRSLPGHLPWTSFTRAWWKSEGRSGGQEDADCHIPAGIKRSAESSKFFHHTDPVGNTDSEIFPPPKSFFLLSIQASKESPTLSNPFLRCDLSANTRRPLRKARFYSTSNGIFDPRVLTYSLPLFPDFAFRILALLEKCSTCKSKRNIFRKSASRALSTNSTIHKLKHTHYHYSPDFAYRSLTPLEECSIRDSKATFAESPLLENFRRSLRSTSSNTSTTTHFSDFTYRISTLLEDPSLT